MEDDFKLTFNEWMKIQADSNLSINEQMRLEQIEIELLEDNARKSFLEFVNTDAENYMMYLTGMDGEIEMNRLILDNAIQRELSIEDSVDDLITVCRTLHVQDHIMTREKEWF